jgi:hypothetical protein
MTRVADKTLFADMTISVLLTLYTDAQIEVMENAIDNIVDHQRGDY